MKLSNLFKKSTKKVVEKSKIEKIEKTQLEKVVGGATAVDSTTTLGARVYTGGR